MLGIPLSTTFNVRPTLSTWNYDGQLAAYFASRVEKIEAQPIWTGKPAAFAQEQNALRKELQEMLGLDPLPVKNPLNATIVSTTEYDEFVVEKVYFESRPGLFVTANIYRPKKIAKPLPAILYVCGHAAVIENGYNYGAKANYQHHPAWFARNGYVCIILDTLQLGELEGIHHGLYRYDRWWWVSRGYTPAGVEAWNGIRALDYLAARSDVDMTRIGVTGRSGGGITSWWIGALDERVKVVVPVAGITDLHNYVVDGCVEGHCDCMFFVNSHQWDYPKVGALIAPRPLLISNSDQDAIFPLDGVVRTHKRIKEVYDKLGASDQIALNIVAGGHKDVQELRIHTFRWFNHFLKGTDDLIEMSAVKFLPPEDIRVFETLPSVEANTTIDETFVPQAGDLFSQLKNASYQELEDQWKANLSEKVFSSWPKVVEGVSTRLIEQQEFEGFSVNIQGMKTDRFTELPLVSITRKGTQQRKSEIRILDDETWEVLKQALGNELTTEQTNRPNLRSKIIESQLGENDQIIYLPIRGAGPAKFSGDEQVQLHIRRRFYLLGETLESMQTWDLVQGFRYLDAQGNADQQIVARGTTAVMCAYASIFSPGKQLQLIAPSASHMDSPFYPGILRFMDVPSAMLMSASENNIVIEEPSSSVYEKLKVYCQGDPSFNFTLN